MKITFEINTKSQEELVEGIKLLESFRSPIHSVTETATEAPKKEKVTPSIPKEEKAVEAPVEKKAPAKKKPVETKVTVEDLKNAAKNATLRVDRVTVKNTIGEFAPKLAEVKPESYVELHAKLEALGK